MHARRTGRVLFDERNRWIKAGSMGRAAAFSFYPGKNLGACGEAGAVTTNDATVAEKIKMLRDHGQEKKYYHDIEGYNGRLDAIQAGILHAKLLISQNGTQSDASELLSTTVSLQANEVITCPYEPPWSRAVYHLYVMRTEDRESLMGHLKSACIGTGIHYPIPLHLQKAYDSLGYMPGPSQLRESSYADYFFTNVPSTYFGATGSSSRGDDALCPKNFCIADSPHQ